MDCLTANGIAPIPVEVKHLNSTNFLLVKDWSFGAPSFSNAVPSTAPYLWRLQVRLGTNGIPDMVPVPTGGVYGDLTSLAGLPGQNTAPPAQKFFARHFISRVGTRYYDPSYGKIYTNPLDFQVNSIEGFAADFGDSSGTNAVFQLKLPASTNEIWFNE